MRTPFGTRFGLSGIPTDAANTLILSTRGAHSILDGIVRRVNDAAGAGIEPALTAAWVAERDLLADELALLEEGVDDLESEAAIPQWRLQLEALMMRATELDAQVQSTVGSLWGTERWSIGLWTTAAVLGTVGAVLGIRWYGKRRKRRWPRRGRANRRQR